MKSKLLLQDAERGYELFETSDGRAFVTVLCGGVGQFERSVLLNEENMQLYREWGKSYLDDFAYRIAQNPDQFPVFPKDSE